MVQPWRPRLQEAQQGGLGKPQHCRPEQHHTLQPSQAGELPGDSPHSPLGFLSTKTQTQSHSKLELSGSFLTWASTTFFQTHGGSVCFPPETELKQEVLTTFIQHALSILVVKLNGGKERHMGWNYANVEELLWLTCVPIEKIQRNYEKQKPWDKTLKARYSPWTHCLDLVRVPGTTYSSLSTSRSHSWAESQKEPLYSAWYAYPKNIKKREKVY